MKEILSRPKEELISRIYHAQKASPKPGDWCKMVQEDFDVLQLQMTDEDISMMGTNIYKRYIKSKTKKASFEVLQAM